MRRWELNSHSQGVPCIGPPEVPQGPHWRAGTVISQYSEPLDNRFHCEVHRLAYVVNCVRCTGRGSTVVLKPQMASRPNDGHVNRCLQNGGQIGTHGSGLWAFTPSVGIFENSVEG